MGKHTPGPWTVQGDGYDTATYVMGRDVLVRGGEADRIIAVCHSYGPLDRISRLHNARLIAAAPDMLEALLAYQAADAADAAMLETIERATAEDWINDPTGSMHVNTASQRYHDALRHANELRDAALTKATA